MKYRSIGIAPLRNYGWELSKHSRAPSRQVALEKRHESGTTSYGERAVSVRRTGPIKESRSSLAQEESPTGYSLYSSRVSYVGDRDESFISRVARERDASVSIADDDGIPFMLVWHLTVPRPTQLANCVNKRYV